MPSPIILHQPTPEKVIRHSLNNSIPAIELLKQNLLQKGLNFLQDRKIGNYTFDFYHPKFNIAIDIDGYAHEFSDVYSNDASKKLHIHSLGIVVLRFTDYQILTDIEEILRAVKNQIRMITKNPYVI